MVRLPSHFFSILWWTFVSLCLSSRRMSTTTSSNRLMERSSVIFWRLEGEKSSSGGLKKKKKHGETEKEKGYSWILLEWHSELFIPKWVRSTGGGGPPDRVPEPYLNIREHLLQKSFYHNLSLSLPFSLSPYILVEIQVSSPCHSSSSQVPLLSFGSSRGKESLHSSTSWEGEGGAVLVAGWEWPGTSTSAASVYKIKKNDIITNNWKFLQIWWNPHPCTQLRVLRLKRSQIAYQLRCRSMDMSPLILSPGECRLRGSCPGGYTEGPDHPHHDVGAGDMDILWLGPPPLSADRLQRLTRREQINNSWLQSTRIFLKCWRLIHMQKVAKFVRFIIILPNVRDDIWVHHIREWEITSARPNTRYHPLTNLRKKTLVQYNRGK